MDTQNTKKIHFGTKSQLAKLIASENIIVQHNQVKTASFDTSTEALVEVWKNKHARKRVKSLVEQNRYSTDSHFYDDLIYMDWPQTKDRFLNQVGR